MNLELVNLVLLQKMDLRMEDLRKVQTDGPKRLEEINTELQGAEDKVNDSLNQEKEMNKRRRALERDLEATDEKIKANLARQLQVKTNEEYRAMLKENDYLRKTNSDREDELLELMEKLDELNQENKRLKVWLEEQRQILTRKKEKTHKWIEQSTKDLNQLDGQRRGLVNDLPANFISLYKRVYEKRNQRAVVPIVDGVCQECHLQIPPQQYNELQRNEELMTCPNCQRIIYWADHTDYESIK